MAQFPQRLTSLLDAVNQCLWAIGESPVSDIDAGESVDVASALNQLAQFDLALQTRGWGWNRHENLRLLPDGNGEIAIPFQTLRISNSYWIRNGVTTSEPCHVVQKGLKLFDVENNTLIFTTGVTCDVVIREAWDNLPQPARSAIAAQAALMMESGAQGNAAARARLEVVLAEAMATLEQAEDEVEDTNAIYENKSVMSALFHGGVRRNRSGRL